MIAEWRVRYLAHKIVVGVSAAVLLLAVSSLPVLAQPRCGATERWFVKAGTDPDANLVSLTTQIPKTVEELNALPQKRQLVPPGNHSFRLPEERTVYVVSGRLVMFKNEADKDYHLVITDDSLRFTPGGPGTAGKETGTSFIAEIVDPDCVAGAHGELGVPSHFQADLEKAKAQFEERFPEGKGADKNLGGIPVRLVGIAFYDRQHLQTGRAVNGIELHPLLDISFQDAGPVGGTVMAGNQILANAGFEESSGWTGSTADIGSYQDQPSHGGDRIAWFCGIGNTTSESLWQLVTIPPTAASARLSLWLHTESEEVNDQEFDRFVVEIRSATGSLLKTLGTFTNRNQNATFVREEFDLSQFIGRDVRVSMKCTEDAERATSFVVDDLALVVQ